MKTSNTKRLSVLLILLSVPVALTGCGGDPEVNKLISELGDEDAGNRRDAIKALENIGLRAEPAVKALGKCLSDKDAKVRYRSAKTLAKMGKASKNAAADLGAALLNDEDQKVKYFSAKALAEIANQEPEVVVPLVSCLVKSLSVDDAKTRYYVVKALGKIGAEAFNAVEEIEKLVDDSDKSVRQAAVSAVKRIRKKHAES